MKMRRDRFAAVAVKHDFLLSRVGADLADRLSTIKRMFDVCANVGSYHGVLSQHLRPLSNVGQMIDVEYCEGLLSQCDGPHVLADDEMMPFADGSLDLVVSGLRLQFINDVPGVLAQVRRALRPDGVFLASVLGGETLTELRQAWLSAEAEMRGGASRRVLPFADVRDYGALLQRAEFALPVVDIDRLTVTYGSPLDLIGELRAMAAGNVLIERSRCPVTRGLLTRVCEIYSDNYADTDGRVPATFDIITMIGWVPHESQQKPLRPGSAKARLADALGAKEVSTGEKPER